ncbi:MAG: GNAT family N-acetyltransferase, partial [Candidatus Sulfotelmatobacter sp.]
MLRAEVEIRRADSQDASAISEVLHEAFIEFKALYSDGGFAATTPNAGQILSRMQEGPVWLALRDGRVLGTVATLVEGQAAHLRGMAVLPSARGSGLGASLLRQAETWAREKGCTRIFLSTTPFLHSAIHLYERHGFRRGEQGPHELFG